MRQSRVQIRKRDGQWFIFCGLHKQLHPEGTFPAAIGWADRHLKVRHSVVYLQLDPPTEQLPVLTGPDGSTLAASV